MEKLQQLAKDIRKQIFKAAYGAQTGHIAPSLSVVEILISLYFDEILKYDSKNPEWKDRDFFVMSKGHASLALYAVLAEAGFFPVEELRRFCHGVTPFGGILKRNVAYGIEASTGSLGQGICFATGVALGMKLDEKQNQVFTVIGDGECQEGTTWEAAMNAAHHGLDNFTVIIDHNQLQGMDKTESIVREFDLASKWKSFGFDTIEVNGHDMIALKVAFQKKVKGKPKAIVANTVKGRGISFMEGIPIWHYRMTNKEETKIVLQELDMTEEELN